MLSLLLLATAWLSMTLPLQSQSQSQPHPDFSGTWVLLVASERSPAVVREMVVTYSAAKNTLTVSRRTGGPAYTDTYTLGSSGGTVVQGQRGPMIKGLRTMVWEQKVLVITDVTSVNRDQDSGREERWSLDDKNQLVTVITVWSPGNSENTTTVLYKRKPVPE